jgi:hypothetical protein
LTENFECLIRPGFFKQRLLVLIDDLRLPVIENEFSDIPAFKVER